MPIKEVVNIDATEFSAKESKLIRINDRIKEIIENHDVHVNSNGVFTIVLDYLESIQDETAERDQASVWAAVISAQGCLVIGRILARLCKFFYDQSGDEGFAKVAENYDYITMEGSGGILCPLCFDEHKIQLEDVIREFNLSSILIADAGLGTINSVVLTFEYMKAHNLPLKGIIFNHYHPGNIMEEDNIFMCEHMTGLPVLAKVQDNATELETDADVLSALYDEVKIR